MDKSSTIHETHKITRLSEVLSVIPTNWGKKDMKKYIFGIRDGDGKTIFKSASACVGGVCTRLSKHIRQMC